MTLQGLGKSIASLEEELGYRLFDRGPFGAKPTEYGRVFLAHARALVAGYDAVEKDLAAVAHAEVGDVRIAAGASFLAELLPKATTRFLAERPRVTLRIDALSWPAVVRGLREGRFEFVAMVPGEGAYSDDDLELEFLFEQRFAVFGSARHPLARRRRLSPQDVWSQRWLISEGETQASDFLQRQLLAAGLGLPRDVIYCAEGLFGKSVMRQQLRLFHGSASFFLEELASGDFVELNVPELTHYRPAALVRRRGASLTAAAAALQDELRRTSLESLFNAVPRGGARPLRRPITK